MKKNTQEKLEKFKARIKEIKEDEELRLSKMYKGIAANGGSPVVYQDGASWIISGDEITEEDYESSKEEPQVQVNHILP